MEIQWKVGRNVKIGKYCIIDDDVEIGDNTVIMNYVELRKGTKIGKNCYIDSYVVTSGDCVIEDDVTLRYGVIIARGCIVMQNSYLSPRVMTNNLDTEKKKIGGALIGPDCFIGTHAVLHHGISIGMGTKVGANSFLNKDTDGGTWMGSPAKKI